MLTGNTDKIYTSKEEVQKEADFYNMGADYSHATIIKVSTGWAIKIKYY